MVTMTKAQTPTTDTGVPIHNARNGGPPLHAQSIAVELWYVTPELAVEWLDLNVANRPQKASGIARYTRDVQEGRWMVNAETIKFDIDGKLIDGQNRLHSCVEADRGFWTMVAKGVPPEAFKTIDTGVKRTFSDILSLLRFKNATILAAAVRELWRYEQGVPGQSGIHANPNNDEGLETLSRHRGIQESLWAAEATNGVIPRPSTSAFCHYVFSIKDASLADWFFNAIRTGAGLNETDALLHLRNRLMREHMEQGTPDRRWQLAMMFKAWNAHRQDRKTKLLRWGDKEDFPEIE